jgi:hypothetical protein
MCRVEDIGVFGECIVSTLLKVNPAQKMDTRIDAIEGTDDLVVSRERDKPYVKSLVA